MRRMYLAIAVAMVCFACNKEKKANDATCENIQNITVYSNSPVAAGKPIEFGTQEVGGYRIYSWTGPGNFMIKTNITLPGTSYSLSEEFFRTFQMLK